MRQDKSRAEFFIVFKTESTPIWFQAIGVILGPGSTVAEAPLPGIDRRLVPCSNRSRGHVIVTIAPFTGGARFSVLTVAPDRSRSVFAMNRPRPSPDPSSVLARLSVLVVT